MTLRCNNTTMSNYSKNTPNRNSQRIPRSRRTTQARLSGIRDTKARNVQVGNVAPRATALNAEPVIMGPGGILLTRRQFLYGAAGVAALAVAGGVGINAINASNAKAQDIPVLNVSEKAVTSSENFEYSENYADAMKLTGSVALPYGTLIWANDPNFAFCLLPTTTGSPLTNIGIIDLQTLGWGTLVTHAVGESKRFEIYDVRGTSSGIVWTEADILEGTWRVYAATFGKDVNNASGATATSATSSTATLSATTNTSAQKPFTIPKQATNYDASPYLNTPVLLAEGDLNWETPTLAAVGVYAYWQELPKATGAASNQNSLLKRYMFGTGVVSGAGTGEDTSAKNTTASTGNAANSNVTTSGKDYVKTVYESPGRMACALSATANGIVFAPRVDALNVYYQLTLIDAQTTEVLDRLILPASMRPAEVGYGNTGFSFGFTGIYSYGGGIANLGTYTPKQAPGITFKGALQNALEEVAAARRTTKDLLDKEGLAKAELMAQTAVNDAYSSCEWFRFARTPLCPPAQCGAFFVVKSSASIIGADLTQNWYFALPVENGAPDYGEFLANSGAVNSIVSYTQINYTPINGETIVECRLKIWKPATGY